ncbi:MAG TPA: DUF6491 family protein [Rhizomicrobium sp.]|nr:DUF6491 family protein [Rhizomicrobium sp.]
MRIVFLAMTAALLGASASFAAATTGNATSKPFCLDATSVAGTGVIDDRTILYRMRDGKVWKNTLRQSCPNLAFRQGFSEIVRGGQICANQQIISVLGTNNPCQLGDFTLENPPKN